LTASWDQKEALTGFEKSNTRCATIIALLSFKTLIALEQAAHVQAEAIGSSQR